MVSVEPSKADNPLVKMAKNVVFQPILFIQALPYVTTQVSTYGFDFLRRPVVWLALAGHGLLLLLPAVDLAAPRVEEVSEPELEEEVSIEAVSLSDILAPAEPVPPPPEEPQTPPPATPPPAAAVPPVLTEIPEQIEEGVEQDETENDDLGDDETENDSGEGEQSFAFDPAKQSALSSSLSQFLGASNEGTSNFDVTEDWYKTDQIYLSFRRKDVEDNIIEPVAFFTADSISDRTYVPLPQATFKQISRNIDLVSREGLGQALENAGMTQVDEGLYGGHPLYGVYDASGQPVNYISLIDLKGTTLVFVWPNDPRQS